MTNKQQEILDEISAETTDIARNHELGLISDVEATDHRAEINRRIAASGLTQQLVEYVCHPCRTCLALDVPNCCDSCDYEDTEESFKSGRGYYSGSAIITLAEDRREVPFHLVKLTTVPGEPQVLNTDEGTMFIEHTETVYTPADIDGVRIIDTVLKPEFHGERAESQYNFLIADLDNALKTLYSTEQYSGKADAVENAFIETVLSTWDGIWQEESQYGFSTAEQAELVTNWLNASFTNDDDGLANLFADMYLIENNSGVVNKNDFGLLSGRFAGFSSYCGVEPDGTNKQTLCIVIEEQDTETGDLRKCHVPADTDNLKAVLFSDL